MVADDDVSGAQSAERTGKSQTPSRRYRLPLNDLADVRREFARLYRAMKADEIDCGKGKSLAYVLGLLARAIEGGEFEKRIEALEARAAGQSR